MGLFYSKDPVIDSEPLISYELLCNALTKWYGKPASYAHVIYLDDLGTSFTSEVVQWKVCTRFTESQTYAELMLKFYPWNKDRGRCFRSADFFKNEIMFYENVLPELLRDQGSKEISESLNNHVKMCFSVRNGKQDAICFGDARVEGFNAKQMTMDTEHGKVTLKTLARFHALSFALKTEDKEKFEALCNNISETLYSEHYWTWYRKLWSKLCSVAIDAVENEYPDSIYVKKIKEFAVPKRYKDLIKAVQDRENGVILHGDCNTSNYLYKYINDKPVEVKMVDFQQARYASPALDVSCILYNNRELLRDFDAMLKYYHGNLVIRIKELGGDPDVYPFDIFMKDIRKYSFFGLAFSFEAVCTKLTRDDIVKKVLEWDKIKNIADAFEVKNLENQERRAVLITIIFEFMIHSHS